MAEDETTPLTNIFDEPTIENNGKADSFQEDGYTIPGEPSLSGRTTERKPRASTARESAANLITLAWGGAGALLAQTGIDVPVGRTLQFQAPMAGNKIDSLLAGTFIDHWLQPIIKQTDKVEGVGSLVMMPVLVGLFERSSPEVGALIEPILREVISQNLVQMAPVIRKRKTQERAAAKAMKEVIDAFGDEIPKGADPIQMILQSIFAPPPGYTPPPPEEP